LYSVGVSAKILQVAPPQGKAPFHLIVQALERFEITEMLTGPPVFRAKVDYWYETEYESNEELRAYSIAIVDSIRELIQLNPLIKEGLTLVLDQIDVNDPSVLADLAAIVTTASGDELQRLLETRSNRARIEQA
jgi:ATP-dependent Lon protease